MKEMIMTYLSGIRQATTKTIASALGIDELVVARELNRLMSEGIVEREKKAGAGNTYWWWLSQDATRPPPRDRR